MSAVKLRGESKMDVFVFLAAQIDGICKEVEEEMYRFDKDFEELSNEFNSICTEFIVN